MNDLTDTDRSDDRWARLRFNVVRPLLEAPPPTDRLHDAFEALAAKSWQHPITNESIQFSVLSIERWFHLARARPHDPIDALRPRGSKVDIKILDDASRLLYHRQWYCGEVTENLIESLVQVVQEHAMPHAVTCDNGRSLVAAAQTRVPLATRASNRAPKPRPRQYHRYTSLPASWTIITDRMKE